MSLRFRTVLSVAALIVAGVQGCASIPPRENPSSLSIWLAPMAGTSGGEEFVAVDAASNFEIGQTISIDTVTFRLSGTTPLLAPRPRADSINTTRSHRFAIVTTFQGSRYHPETIRALGEDTVALASVAGEIAREASDRGIHSVLLDFQGMSQSDLSGLVATVRALKDSLRSKVPGTIGLILPPGDTVAYPTRPMAAIAPSIVVRVYGEHRPGTSPGTLANPEWISRQLGLRAIDAGVNRLMAELPLFGYQWLPDGSARSLSYAEASRLVAAEASTFRRDQLSGFLTATGRDGWTIWIPDAQTVERMIRVVMRAGISRVILTGVDGSDPDLLARLPALKR